MKPSAIVRVRDLSKSYSQGETRLLVFDGISLDIMEGEFFALMGASGSGKSTLLNLLSGIDKPDGGQIFVDGEDIATLDDRRQTLLRRDQIGIVFQFFNLIPTLTALEKKISPCPWSLAARD